VERKRIETLAEAERQKRMLEAQGGAEAARLAGKGQADANREVGLADADVIRAKGKAEADAMHMRAGAFQEYNQAAVLDKLLSGLPEVARAMASPLNNVDKITIVSTGDGRNGMGASQITGDVAKMVAQLPELFETLTGVKVGDLMSRVTGISSTPPTPVITPHEVLVAGNGASRPVTETPAEPAPEPVAGA
jgi:flotillin